MTGPAGRETPRVPGAALDNGKQPPSLPRPSRCRIGDSFRKERTTASIVDDPRRRRWETSRVMNINMSTCVIRSLPSAIAASLAFLTLGCGDDGGLGRRYAVSGKVAFNGQPVKRGVINFVPTMPEGHG